MQNILESQVSDLSSLVDSPIAISVSGTPAAIPIMGAPPGPARDAPSIDRSVRGESSITSQGQGNQRNDNRMSIDGRDAKERDGREGGGGGAGQGNGNQKRKSDEVNGGQQQGNGQPRAKRNRYISIAWYVSPLLLPVLLCIYSG